jgi:hypothetical protein
MADPVLTLLVLKTRQIDKLRQFYQAIGIEFVQEQHGKGPVHYAGHAGGTVIEIYPAPDDASINSSIRLGFAVDNLAEVVGALETAANASLPKIAAAGLQAIIRDPDGRSVELKQK